MKRLISTLLVLLMVMSMCVTAVAYTTPTPPVRNTTDLFDREAETLYAAYGTPSVDGVKDAIWNNAFSYAGNKGTAAIMNPLTSVSGGTTITSNASTQIRFMWDEENLYILEERFDENYDTDRSGTDDVSGRNTWTGGDKTMFNLITPSDMYAAGEVKSYQMVIEATQALKTTNYAGEQVTKPAGSIAPSVNWIRENVYNSYIPTLSGKPYIYDYQDDPDLAGFGGFIQITDTGFMVETVIPWTLLDHDNFDPFEPEIGNEFGVKIYPNYGTDAGTKVCHINHSIGSGLADYMGYAPVKLIQSVSPYIMPDTSWYTDNPDADTYEIADAADLLGLVYLTHAYKKYGFEVEYPSDATDAEKATIDHLCAIEVTKDKTFNITADINLNPGYVGAPYTVPGNIWHGIKYFAGTLNGNGHTISGLYNNANTGTDYSGNLTFIHHLEDGATVKNLTLEGSLIADDASDKTGVVAYPDSLSTVTNVTNRLLTGACSVHSWDNGRITLTATHLRDGLKVFTCDVCGETKTETIPRTTAHTWGSWSKYSSTQHRRQCACDAWDYASHTWDVGTVVTPPSQGSAGVKRYTCTGCGATRDESFNVHFHDFGDWINYSLSQHERQCACGEAEYAAHTWDEGEVTTPATHLAEGVTTYTCLDCGATRTEAIEKTNDHSYGDWSNYSISEHDRKCDCGKVEYADHVWNSGVITVEPTANSVGVMTYTCVDCGATQTATLEKLPNQGGSSGLPSIIPTSGCASILSSGFGMTLLLLGAAGVIACRKKKD